MTEEGVGIEILTRTKPRTKNIVTQEKIFISVGHRASLGLFIV